MKRRILTLALTLILIFSLLAVPASAASYTNVYNKLKNYAKSGPYYGGDNDPLEGEHGNSVTYEIPITEYGWLGDDVFKVFYSDRDRLELRLGSNTHWTWVIVPRNIGEPWEIKAMEHTVYRGSALIDPATYTAETDLTVYTFTGDESNQEELLNQIKFYFPAILDFTSKVLANLGCQLTDLGFMQFPNNESHYWYQYSGSPATCTSDGHGYFACRYCNEERYMEIPSYGGHAWDGGTVITEPTCTEIGGMLFRCTRCSDFYDVDIPALGHAWNEAEVSREPTCIEDGVRQCTCDRCGETKEEVLPALGHIWTYTETLTEDPETGHGTALYTCSRCEETKEDLRCAGVIFTDMPSETNWAHAPIDWAYFNHITSGKTPTTFAPKDTVTRAESMTFLWLTLGSPEPETTDNPFEDVKEGKYYYKPVLWAVENGITSGTGETTFGPKDPCTRAQILTFLWIAAGRPEPETTENPFTDVKEGKYYYKAVLWGVENHITSGVAPDLFGTGNTCTRAQIVAFLYKAKDLMIQGPAVQPEPTEPGNGFVGWRWMQDEEFGGEMDYVMEDWQIELGATRLLVVAVRGDAVPTVYTDRTDVLYIMTAEPLPDSENGDKNYVWMLNPNGKGVAQVFCEIDGEIVASLTATIGSNP